MENLTLSSKLVEDLGNYLGTKPFVEVSGLLNAMQQEIQKQIQPPQSSAK